MIIKKVDYELLNRFINGEGKLSTVVQIEIEKFLRNKENYEIFEKRLVKKLQDLDIYSTRFFSLKLNREKKYVIRRRSNEK